jgi:predicted methyltransferase
MLTPQEALREIRAEQGLDFVRSRRIVCRLATGGPATVTELVEATGAPRRWVEGLARSLEGFVEQTGDRYRLVAEHAEQLADVCGCADLHDASAFAALEGDAQALVTDMATIASELPPSLWSLDHVPATADTAVRRAHLLRSRHDLAGRTVLCLGDHDLTSIALALLEPDVDLLVVDIDEELLGFIASVAADRRLPIRTLFADLRAELAPSAVQSADLVFTDPPYTPDGVELFVARGLAALKPSQTSRLLFCYSHSPAQPARALDVQAVMPRFKLVLEALLPEFNRYRGAESIGSASALWICRPTKRTWAAAERYRSSGPHVYTRGASAEEALAPLPIELPGHIGEAGRERQVLLVSGGDAGTPAGARRVPLESLLRSEPPAGRGGAFPAGSELVVDLRGYHGGYVQRLLLRAPSIARAVFYTSPRDLRRSGLERADEPLRKLLSPAYELSFPAAPHGSDHAVVVAVPVDADPASAFSVVVRYILEHPTARIANAWREALIELADRHGLTLSKNEARSLIAASSPPVGVAQSHLCELPTQALRTLVASLEQTVRQVMDGVHDGEVAR